MPQSVEVRRVVAAAATAAQPYVRNVAGRLLRSEAFAHGLNRLEERAGGLVIYPRRDLRVSDLAAFLFHTTALRDEFSWTCHVADAAFVVPVDPDFPRPSPSNDPWGPASYWHRPDNRKIRDFYERYLTRRPSGVFLDIGANWGMHLYPFAAAGYRCVGFEPQTACCEFIERVRALNRFTNLDIVQSAVGAGACEAVPFFESDIAAFSSMNQEHVAAFNQPWRQLTIGCVTLDAYCEQRQLSPTLIKIDTEGFEWEVLRGAMTILQALKPTILVEVSSPLEQQHAMWEALAGLGYRCYAVDRSMRARYPAQPFTLVHHVAEFTRRGLEGADTGSYESDADFVFLQPQDDVLST